MEVTVGTWVFPLFISLAAFAVALAEAPFESRGDYDFASPIIGCAALLLALCVSLAAWLVWAVL